jgi:hypothetical protein
MSASANSEVEGTAEHDRAATLQLVIAIARSYQAIERGCGRTWLEKVWS